MATSQPQPRKLQAIDAKRRVPAKPLPAIRDGVLRDLEAAGGDLARIGDGHKVSRRDAMRFFVYAVSYQLNRMVERVDGYGAPVRIGPQSENCPHCAAARKGAA